MDMGFTTTEVIEAYRAKLLTRDEARATLRSLGVRVDIEEAAVRESLADALKSLETGPAKDGYAANVLRGAIARLPGPTPAAA